MKSKVDAVLVNVKSYEEKLELNSLIKLIDEAKEKFVAGKTRSFREFIKEFKDARKIYN